MNKYFILIVKALRKLYSIFFKKNIPTLLPSDKNPDSVSEIIYNKLIATEPCMIARFGANELRCLCNYLSVVNKSNKNVMRYIRGEQFPWWWEESNLEQMCNNAGFFPKKTSKLAEYSQLMLNDIPSIDILGAWLLNENSIQDKLENSIKVQRIIMEPFWTDSPWTRALKGKRVLVVHPFSQTIESQYKKRTLIFKNDFLPKFELITLKAVQSITGIDTEFSDWFEALNYMKNQIDQIDYDICLIGAGAYGFNLAAHVKRQGKKSVHLGGSLQLLFGIKGARWENPDYNSQYNYINLMNEYWVKPLPEETPTKSKEVEGACYW